MKNKILLMGFLLSAFASMGQTKNTYDLLEVRKKFLIAGKTIDSIVYDTGFTSNTKIPTALAVRKFVEGRAIGSAGGGTDSAAVRKFLTSISTINSPAINRVVITDTLRGGDFYLYTGLEIADGGIIFNDGMGRKFRRKSDMDYVRPEWFYTGGFWDDAMNKARLYCNSHPSTKKIKLSSRNYEFLNTIIFYESITIEGESSLNGEETLLTFQRGSVGLQFIETKYDYNITLRNFALYQKYSAGDKRDSSKHAIVLRCKALMENINVLRFDGDGLNIETDDDEHVFKNFGSTAGSVFNSFKATNTYNGVFITGREASTMMFNKLFTANSARYGVYDYGRLGNMYNTPQCDVAGVTDFKTIVKYNGKFYTALNNKWIINKNKRPDLFPTFWYDMGEALMPANPWSPSIEYFGGGPIKIENPNAWSTIIQGYFEGFQPPVQLNTRSISYGGTLGSSVIGGSAWVSFDGQISLLSGALNMPRPGSEIVIGGENDTYRGTAKFLQTQGFGVKIENTKVGGHASLEFQTKFGKDNSIAPSYISLVNPTDLQIGVGGKSIMYITNNSGVFPVNNNVTDFGTWANRWRTSFTTGINTKKINIVEGANATIGTGTFVSGVATVVTSAVSSGSKIFATLTNCSRCGSIYIGTIKAGASFIVNSTNAADASNFNWWIVN